MSLPTPPGTSRRRKEKKRRIFSLAEPGSSRIVWSEINEIFSIEDDDELHGLPPKYSHQVPPGRPILKKIDHPNLLPLEEEREVTPEPEDPLTDLTYLVNPVSKIVATDATLRDLIESYNILAVRLRACITGATDVDASWPLFQPLRQYRDQLVEAMVRDLHRALEDPKATALAPEHDVENVPFDPKLLASCLPSPKQSPKRKRRGGLSGEQAKWARDLCTVAQAALKMLSAVFTFPSIYQIFTGQDFTEICYLR